MEPARATREEEDDEALFELQPSSSGIEASLRKLLKGFDICGGGSFGTTHEPSWEPPATAEKPEPVVEVNNRSVIPSGLSSETAKQSTSCNTNADNETCGESQSTTTGSINDEKMEKTAPATATTNEDKEPTPATKESTEEKDEWVPTTQDRSLATTDKVETQPETTDNGEEIRAGSGWAGWVWILFVAALATIMVASLHVETGTDIEGLGLQVKQFLEQKLAENAQASVSLNDIVQETVVAAEEDQEETTASSTGKQDKVPSAEVKDEKVEDSQQYTTEELVEEDSTVDDDVDERVEDLDEEKVESAEESDEPLPAEAKPSLQSELNDGKRPGLGRKDDDASKETLAKLQRELAELLDDVPQVKGDKAGVVAKEL